MADNHIWVGGFGTGEWSNASNWNPAAVPISTDTVTFDATSSNPSNLDAGFAGTVAGVTINGYTGTITQNRSLTVDGTFSQGSGTFTGSSAGITVTNFSLSGGTFVSTAGTLACTVNWTHTAGGIFNHGGGTVAFSSDTSTTYDGTDTFNNLSVNKLECKAIFETSP